MTSNQHEIATNMIRSWESVDVYDIGHSPEAGVVLMVGMRVTEGSLVTYYTLVLPSGLGTDRLSGLEQFAYARGVVEGRYPLILRMSNEAVLARLRREEDEEAVTAA